MRTSDPDTHCLIVGDGDVLIRNALADYLRGCGYKVIEAATTDEIVVAIEAGSQAIDAILVDADIAGRLNAFELRLWLRDHWPQVTIILAGSIDKAARAAGDLCDDGPHLARPYDPASVAAHIKRLLAAARS